MRILILFLLTFGILLAEDLGLQEDIDVNYKRMVREKKGYYSGDCRPETGRSKEVI